MKKILVTAAFISLFAMGSARDAQAQSAQFPLITSIEGNYVGVGLGFVPDYVGSDDYDFGAAPMARYEFGGHRNIELIGNYATINILNCENWEFGPAAQYRFGRDDDIDDDTVELLGEIDDTIELGAALSYKKILDGNPRNRFIASLDVLHDVGDEHEGLVGTASVRYWDQVSEKIDLGIAGSVQYGSDDFTDTFFSVSSAGSAASGLDEFDADGGIKSFRVMPMAVMHLNERWHIGAGVRWERLTGDAEDSPIVDVRGDENQFIGGIGIVYAWDFKTNRR